MERKVKVDVKELLNKYILKLNNKTAGNIVSKHGIHNLTSQANCMKYGYCPSGW